MLRRQALHWLRADLAFYATEAGRNVPELAQAVRQRLEHWWQDADLASVRDEEALRQLPEDERQHWRALWDEVAALRADWTRQDPSITRMLEANGRAGVPLYLFYPKPGPRGERHGPIILPQILTAATILRAMQSQ